MTDDAAAHKERCRNALALYHQMESSIRSVIYRWTRDQTEQDDIAQEVFIRIMTMDAVPETVRAYILTITRNICMDRARHRTIVRIEYIPDVGEEDFQQAHPSCHLADVSDALAAEEEVQLLLNAADQLPAHCRAVFLYRKIYGYSQREIATGLGISENTVEQHLMKAALLLTTMLDSSKVDGDNIVHLFGVGKRRKKR